MIMVSAYVEYSNKAADSYLQKDQLYGARFKSWTGGNGLARKYACFPHFQFNHTTDNWIA